jgi:hypothetical protein
MMWQNDIKTLAVPSTYQFFANKTYMVWQNGIKTWPCQVLDKLISMKPYMVLQSVTHWLNDVKTWPCQVLYTSFSSYKNLHGLAKHHSFVERLESPSHPRH